MKKKLAYISCTVLGAGYFPGAPGTFASLIAALYIYLFQPELLTLLFSIVITLIIGILFTAEIEKNDGKDPKHIVIDELAGQWLTFLFISKLSILTIISGFILFRVFDILKPFGVNALQNLKSGWGVMLDDILAGIYAAIALQLLILTGFIL